MTDRRIVGRRAPLASHLVASPCFFPCTLCSRSHLLTTPGCCSKSNYCFSGPYPSFATMATDADIVPETVTDFVFDLYDSVTLSQLTEEQGRLYNHVFRDLSSKVRPLHCVFLGFLCCRKGRLFSCVLSRSALISSSSPNHQSFPNVSTLEIVHGPTCRWWHASAMVILFSWHFTAN
jgi:hypothetical protein